MNATLFAAVGGFDLRAGIVADLATRRGGGVSASQYCLASTRHPAGVCSRVKSGGGAGKPEFPLLASDTRQEGSVVGSGAGAVAVCVAVGPETLKLGRGCGVSRDAASTNTRPC